MIIDCISDLHGHYPKLEGGDLLIVAGDLTARDEHDQYMQFSDWIRKQNYRKKIVIAGNHDNRMVETKDRLMSHVYCGDAEYLCDSGTEFVYWERESPGVEDTAFKKNLKIWGSPWTKTFPGMNPNCKAFTCDTEDELVEKWALIPLDTHLVITHSPPYGIRDKTERGELAGSQSLLIKMAEIKPIIHCFGHIHEQGGKETYIGWKNGTTFINASYVDERYNPKNKETRIYL